MSLHITQQYCAVQANTVYCIGESHFYYIMFITDGADVTFTLYNIFSLVFLEETFIMHIIVNMLIVSYIIYKLNVYQYMELKPN